MSAAQQEFDELMRDKSRQVGHPDDDDDARSFLNLSDDDDDDATPPASAVDPDDIAALGPARYQIPSKRYDANTGPKGVIADAQNFRDSHRTHRQSLRSNSNLAPPIDPFPSSYEEGAVASVEDEDEDGHVDDEDFMRKWRRNRLKEMRAGTRESNGQTRGNGRRKWGKLALVDGEGYLDALDRSPPDTVVVVYIYDDYSHVSIAIEECVRTLAQKHLNVRFIKLNSDDAQMEPAGVPALLAYRGGEKFAGLVPVIQEIPDDADLSAGTLEAVLRRHQILS